MMALWLVPLLPICFLYRFYSLPQFHIGILLICIIVSVINWQWSEYTAKKEGVSYQLQAVLELAMIPVLWILFAIAFMPLIHAVVFITISLGLYITMMWKIQKGMNYGMDR